MKVYHYKRKTSRQNSTNLNFLFISKSFIYYNGTNILTEYYELIVIIEDFFVIYIQLNLLKLLKPHGDAGVRTSGIQVS